MSAPLPRESGPAMDRTERYEIPLRDVSLSDSERHDILRAHGRIDERVRESWDEAGNCTLVRVRLPEPICDQCGEPWGKYGCPTYRAVVLLGIYEREAQRSARRIEELTEALTPRFGVHHLRNQDNGRIELRMYVDEYTLLYGGLGVVTATLKRMHDEWRRWFKNVGDQRRARADKMWATAIDSDRYVYLTQTFDPHTSATKMPEAPWSDPDWNKATTAVTPTPGGRDNG